MSKISVCKSAYTIVLIFITATTWLSAQTPIGLAILNSSMGNDPRNVPFRVISWPNPNSAALTQLDGARSIIDQAEITKILYFDQAYYDAMNGDTQISGNRVGIQPRESVIQVQFQTIESEQDCGQVEASLGQLKEIQERFPSTASDLKAVMASLETVVSKYKSGQREVMGTWMTQSEMDAQRAPTPTPVAKPKLSFTTKDNQHFENVTVSLGDLGLNVMTSDGGTTIPFDQLPNDLSGFSKEIQTRVKQVLAATKEKNSEGPTRLRTLINLQMPYPVQKTKE